jgi:O-antigen/teichoic acid export membrane protein
MSLSDRWVALLRSLERYTKTDMVYLAKGGFWINLGSVTVSLFSFILYLAFARFLPQEVYGNYQYLLAVSSIIGAFTLTGMNNALVRAVAKGHEGTVRASIPLQLRWGLLPLVGAWAIGAYYLAHGNPVLGFGLLLIGLFVPLNNALNSFAAWIGGRKDFRTAFFYNFFLNLLYYPALIIAAYFSPAALVLLAVNLIAQAIALYFSYRAIEKKYRPNQDIDVEAFAYGKHLSLMGVINNIAQQIDNVLIFQLLGAAPLAIYSFATAFPDRIASLVKFIPAIALPKLAVRTTEEVKATLLPRLAWGLLGSAFVAGCYMFLAPFFFKIFFPTYMSAVPYSIAYGLMIVPALAAWLFSTMLTAQGSVRALYIFNSVMSVLQIVLLGVGVWFWGLWGLIAAKILTVLLQGIVGGMLYFLHPSVDQQTTG